MGIHFALQNAKENEQKKNPACGCHTHEAYRRLTAFLGLGRPFCYCQTVVDIHATTHAGS